MSYHTCNYCGKEAVGCSFELDCIYNQLCVKHLREYLRKTEVGKVAVKKAIVEHDRRHAGASEHPVEEHTDSALFPDRRAGNDDWKVWKA